LGEKLEGLEMKYLQWLAGTLLVLAATQTVEARGIRCDVCSADARRQLAASAGVGTHVVYDLVLRTKSGYRVTYDQERRINVAMPAAVDPKISQLVDALADFHAETGGSMRKWVEVQAEDLGIGGLDSAYDVIDDRNLRLRVGDRLARSIPADGMQAFNNIIQLLGQLGMAGMGFTGDAAVTVIVRFADGTTVDFRVEPGNPRGQYQEESGRSENGDGLLESNDASFAGIYRFQSNDDLHDFIERARILGIQITGPGGGTMRCTWNGHELRCGP
jgi:hypothetical protein